MSEKNSRLFKCIALLIVAALSFFLLARIASDPDTYGGTLDSLNQKQETVLALTAGATAASTAISMIPGDAGTPIAEKLMDLGSSFLLVLTAVFLEKYLLTITGYVAFKFLIPIVCILYIVDSFLKKDALVVWGRKLLLFAVAIVFVIPLSVRLSDLIDQNYQNNIEQTISATEELENSSESTKTETESKGSVSGIFDKVKDTASGITDKIVDTAAGLKDKAASLLNHFMEALAVMLVTSCVIPILVLVFFLWLCNGILGTNLTVPRRISFRKPKIEK